MSKSSSKKRPKRKGERPIDAGIASEVAILQENGVHTTESCQGGPGHTFPEPTVRFLGDRSEGFRVAAICIQYGLRLVAVRRYWQMQFGELAGPFWEVTFYKPAS